MKDCHKNTVENKELTFYYVKRKSLAQTAAWVQAIHRENEDKSDWQPSSSTVICSRHFITGKYSTEFNHPDYAPSLHLPGRKPKTPQDLARQDRVSI